MTFIIAELGINHNGDLDTAKRLIAAAKEAGASAVKFQAYTAEELEPEGGARDLLKRYELTRDDHIVLAAHAKTLDIPYLCTPFSVAWLRFLADEIGLKQFKIASGHLDNNELLRAAANAGSVILSTGASTLEEIRTAIGTINAEPRPNGGGLVVLHCVSAYPAEPNEMNLKAMALIRDDLATRAGASGTGVGLSDHSKGIAVSVAAVALGAVMIEKHLTLDRRQDGPDHRASLDPEQFADLVGAIRKVEQAMGDGRKRVMPGEAGALETVRRRALHRTRVADAAVAAPVTETEA